MMKLKLRGRATALLLAIFIGGCGSPSPLTPANEPAPPAWFEDATQELGIDFVHDAGPRDETFFLPQIMGSGAAVFDFDGDGRLDVYLMNFGGPKGEPNRLFNQMPNGKFRDVSRGSGLDVASQCQGVAIGDVNNDGYPDDLLTEYRGVRLFLNSGKGSFTEVATAGLGNPFWAASAAFVDYDRDGWLDIVVANYLDYDPKRQCSSPSGRIDFCSPASFSGTMSKLFRNLGANGAVRFDDVTVPSGLSARPGPGLGVLCADFTGDGWPDLFISNDGRPNHLWVNQKNGSFKEEAVIRGVATNVMGKAEANMGIAWGDVDGDGLEDLFVTHLDTETNTLWKQGPRGLFQDRTVQSMLSRPAERATGFGTVLGDFNCDGALDVAIVNGGVVRSAAPEEGPRAFFSQYFQRNQVFENVGSGRFVDRSAANGGSKGLCGYGNIGRCIAVADLANDGHLWLLTTEVGGRAHLFRNVAPDRGHWMVVRAFDPALNRDAIGAEITLQAGTRKWLRTVQSNGGYMTSTDVRVHFGLGAIAAIDSIHVLWPDGSREMFSPRKLDSHVELRRGTGMPAP
jgi:hypothetical protein